MGDVLSCVADAGGAVADIGGGASDVIDAEALAAIAEAAAQACVDMPSTYDQVKSDLIWSMWHASPEPFEEEFTTAKLTWRQTKSSEVIIRC